MLKLKTLLLAVAMTFSAALGAAMSQREDIRTTCDNQPKCVKEKANAILRQAVAYGAYKNQFCTDFSQYRFQDIEDIYPIAECEKDASEIQASDARKAQELIDYQKNHAEMVRVREDEEKRQVEEKQQKLESDLKSGKVRPNNLYQASIAYGAEPGLDLASAPKIKPDGRLYALYGKIEKADTRPEFIAHASRGQEGDAVSAALRWKSQETRYFMVRVPRPLQSAYFDQAKIGRGFDLVGKYVANFSYTTVGGQQKSAPVFEAIHLKMWE